jgi:ABC-type sugar transport system ATPase subunit
MIKIENLRKTFGDTVALDNINLEIQDGEFIALLGPSGCGKTTTLNCIAGLLEPTSGHIYFDNEDVTDKAPKDRNIGMCFQSYALYPHMTVLDNIAFPLKQKKMPKEERYAKAREIAERLQLTQYLERKPGQLSGGQQQRVAMCRAMVKEPNVLLLDEPMSNLDARLKIEVREVIKKLQEEFRVTAIIVTHDQEEAMAIADRIAILDNGRIQQYDSPQNLYERPANQFVANYMGNPPMNFLEAEIISASSTCAVKIGNAVTDLSEGLQKKLKDYIGQKVTVGVRAHQVHITEDSSRALPMHVSMVESLGKDLLITGSIEGIHMRVVDENTNKWAYYKSKIGGEPIWIRFGDVINVFYGEERKNLSL